MHNWQILPSQHVRALFLTKPPSSSTGLVLGKNWRRGRFAPKGKINVHSPSIEHWGTPKNILLILNFIILDVIKIARISPATAKSGYASSSCLGPCIVCAALPKASGCSPAKGVPVAQYCCNVYKAILVQCACQYCNVHANTCHPNMGTFAKSVHLYVPKNGTSGARTNILRPLL